MSTSRVETVTSMADRLKLVLAVAVLLAGIVGFSVLEAQPAVVRVGSFLGGLVLAALIAWTSEPGRRTLGFTRESYGEVRRVVWPTRKETIQMTGVVFAFAVVMAIFLWLVDWLLETALYGWLLGWR